MEIEANLRLPNDPQPEAPVAQKQKPNSNDEMVSAVEDLQTNFGGKGGNLSDMRYIRLKIKTLNVED
jgi:hypothetical protein